MPVFELKKLRIKHLNIQFKVKEAEEKVKVEVEIWNSRGSWGRAAAIKVT